MSMKFGTSYFGNRMLEHAKKDMKLLKEKGFSYVVHTFSEFDLMFHKENLRDIVNATRDIGLEVHLSPWGVGNVFGGEPFSHFVNHHYLDACQVLDNERPVPLACPNAPAFREYMNKWLDAVIDIQPDAVFWDEPHFHEQGFLSSIEGHWGCRCEYCQQNFKQKYGYDMPETESGDVFDFKTASIASFIGGLTEIAKKAGIGNILYLNPNIDPANPGDHWDILAKNPTLDVLATGAYWKWKNEPTAYVSDFAGVIKQVCNKNDIKAQLWLQNFGFEKNEGLQIREAVQLAYDKGIRNIAFWSFKACEHESWLAGEYPKRNWKNTINVIEEFSKA